MTRRRRWWVAVGALLVVTLVLVIRNQVVVYLRGVERSTEMRGRQAPPTLPAEVIAARREMFDLLQPVTVSNCALERIGGRNDGSYLMCGNLLDRVQAGYSYGIGGHDKWGCEIANRIEAPVHQYDCFDPARPRCWSGDTVFHDECVGGATEAIDGRLFDTVPNQIEKNGDTGNRVVMKMDIEGSEWDTILAMSDDTMASIDQLAVEFHWNEDQALGWVHDPRYLASVLHLKRHFEVAHIHFNNMTCVGNLEPFPAHAFEVLFVNKQLAVVDPEVQPVLPHPLDTPARWWVPDCQLHSPR